MSPSLVETIELLYETFQCYRLGPHIDGCPCCVSERDQETIREAPLRQLSSAQLQLFAHKVATTWGGERELKHFMPRILELVALDSGMNDPETVFGKLAYCDWWNWPVMEQDAVRRYFHALWSKVLSVDGSVGSFDDTTTVLRSIAQAERDLSSYLDEWLNDPSESSCRCLAEFVNENADRIVKNKFDPFNAGSEGMESMRQASEWLRLPQIGTKLEDAFFRWSSKPFAEDLSLAVQWAARLREDKK